jgi:hypothetical protein
VAATAGSWGWAILPAHALWCAQAFLAPDLYFWMSLAAALAVGAGSVSLSIRFYDGREL